MLLISSLSLLRIVVGPRGDSANGWSKSDIPTLNVESDSRTDERLTQVTIDTRVSTRWTLAINTNKIEDFRLKGSTFIIKIYFFLKL